MISLYFFIIVIIGVFVFFRKRSADLYKFSRAYRDYRYNIEINIKKAIVTISANMICFVLRNENSGLEDEHLFLQFKMTDRSTEKVLVGKLVDFDWQIRHVMGSSVSRNLEESLTEVSFLVNNRSDARSVTVEFTKNELKELISTLQNAIGN